jgi:alkylhydroperoxidase family enzyme
MVNGCEYCTRAHSAYSKRAGVTAEPIAALPSHMRSPLFDEKEKTAIMYGDRVTRAAIMIRAAELERLRQYYTDACRVHGEFHEPLP